MKLAILREFGSPRMPIITIIIIIITVIAGSAKS
jgi:hypothetical protein